MQQHLRNLIAQGRTDEALAALQASDLLDTRDQNLVIQLSGRYAENERRHHGGGLSEEHYGLERGRINGALLAVVENLEGEHKGDTMKKHNKSTGSQGTKIMGIIVGAVGLLAGIAEISGFSLKDFLNEKEVPEIAKPMEKLNEKDTLVLEVPKKPVVVAPSVSKQNASPRNNFESRDQSKQVNVPDNQGTVNINQ